MDKEQRRGTSRLVGRPVSSPELWRGTWVARTADLLPDLQWRKRWILSIYYGYPVTSDSERTMNSRNSFDRGTGYGSMFQQQGRMLVDAD